MWRKRILGSTAAIFFVGGMTLGAALAGSHGKDEVEIAATPLGGGVHMLTGKGGNIGLFAGPDGAFMIDSQFKGLSAKISKAIAEITDKKLKFVVNTHWHFDHVGGNENFAAKGAVIVAHENVRKLMASDQFLKAFGKKVPAAPKNALPAIGFTKEVTFHLNDETIRVVHVPNAHTHGDAVIQFIKADVIHAGDIYFNGFYPFIDYQHGGTIGGMVRAVDRILEMSGPNTKIIPGHGPLSNRKELKRYRDMLDEVGHSLLNALSDKKSLAELIKNSPIAKFDKEWGDGFLKPETFLSLVYEGMKKRP